MNKGERGELLVKIRLTQMREDCMIFNGETIIDVGFRKSYKSIPFEEYGTCNIDMGDQELSNIANIMNIEKASIYDKSDVFVNNVGYSLKSTYAANSALVNHTNRLGFQNVCEKNNVDITKLDEIIDEYWKLRIEGIISEDIHNSDFKSPFKDHKEYLRPILEYFLFEGSGSRKSKYPAEFILGFSDPLDESKWRIVSKKEAVDSLWPNLVFSMRSKKGMPANYTLAYKGKGASSIAKWVRYIDGDYRGALHIRVKGAQKYQ